MIGSSTMPGTYFIIDLLGTMPDTGYYMVGLGTMLGTCLMVFLCVGSMSEMG